ncbi:hypothetical protein CEXT_459691 [Caerostris extrusa]|uniref:Prolactin receptor n=1 Tax=Caerostris extrusa TaxID=172846 RepID=A0AAV4QSR2_CAEEX|nr:hypothetical protein CEXT_459691 [Caerostris extrusa]
MEVPIKPFSSITHGAGWPASKAPLPVQSMREKTLPKSADVMEGMDTRIPVHVPNLGSGFREPFWNTECGRGVEMPNRCSPFGIRKGGGSRWGHRKRVHRPLVAGVGREAELTFVFTFVSTMLLIPLTPPPSDHRP